eukprot:s4752_g5.t1
MDLRFVKMPKSRLSGESASARVTSYLQSLYDSVAETLPDIKDDGVITSLQTGRCGEADTYAKALSTDGGPVVVRKWARKYKHNLKLHQERHPSFAAKRELSKDFQDNILKHCPALRSYGLVDAADHLEAWVTGSLELEEPLDISG